MGLGRHSSDTACQLLFFTGYGMRAVSGVLVVAITWHAYTKVQKERTDLDKKV